MDQIPNQAAPAAATPPPQPDTFVFPKSSRLLDDAYNFYKQHLGTLLAIYSPVVLLTALYGSISYATTPPVTAQNPHPASAAYGILIPLTIITVFFSIWAFTAIVKTVSQPAEHPNMASAYRHSIGDIIPLILSGLLAGLAILGGLILLIIPGIIFSFWFSQVGYVVIVEKLSGTKALKQSKLYAKGNVWQIFVKGLYIALIGMVISILIALIFAVLGIAIKSAGVIYASILVNLLFSLFWTPLAAIYSYLVYTQIRASKQPLNTSPAQL